MTTTDSTTTPARAPGTAPALVRHFGLVWVLCRVRKDAVCYLTGRGIKAGTMAYRPITHGKLRMHRIKPNVKDEGRGIPRPSTSDCSTGGDA